LNDPNAPPPSLPDVAQEVRRRLEASRRPLILSHVRLDGDALGSQLALAHILRQRGGAPHCVNDGAIPRAYRFLPGVAEVGTSPADLAEDYDLAVALDLPTWERADAIRKKLPADLPVVGIDHHPPVDAVGQVNWIDPGMSSVGEMLFLLARAAGWPIAPEAAECLYVAIVTDTGRFTFANARPSTFRTAASLIELGADHARIAERLYQEAPAELVILRAETLRTLRRHAGDRIAVMSVTKEMLRQAGVAPIDTQQMADLPRDVAGVLVGVLLMEMESDSKIKVSLRARKGFDIEPVARKLGGGGHRAAAGCQVQGDLSAVEALVVHELAEALRLADGAGRT